MATPTIIVPGGVSSPLTTKGDIWGYTTTNARIPVSTDGLVLTARSTASQGVDWESTNTGLPWTTSGDMVYLVSSFGTNLALAATPSLNNQGGFTDPAGNINDNNVSTHAYVTNNVGAGFQLDFGTATTINLTQVVWHNACDFYKIQGSNDNSTWTDLTGSLASCGSNCTDTYDLTPGSYRYVRLYALSGFHAPGVAVDEFRIFDATLTPTRLPIGTTGQVLESTSGIPTWTTTGVINPTTFSVVQTAVSASSSGDPVCTFGSTPTSGNTLIALAMSNSGGVDIKGVTQTNVTWFPFGYALAWGGGGAQFFCRMFMAVAGASAGTSVTANMANTNTQMVWAFEASGLAPALQYYCGWQNNSNGNYTDSLHLAVGPVVPGQGAVMVFMMQAGASGSVTDTSTGATQILAPTAVGGGLCVVAANYQLNPTSMPKISWSINHNSTNSCMFGIVMT